MIKREFMNKLEQLLMDLSQDERIEALQYYEDYFADAGDDKEQDIIAELGSPEALAKIIKNEVAVNAMKPDLNFNYPVKSAEKEAAGEASDGTNQYYYDNTNNNNNEYQDYYSKSKKKMTGGKLALIITGAVFLGPFIIGIAAALFGIFISVFAVIGSLVIAFCAAGAALILGGAVCIVVGILNLFTSAPQGIFIAGAGLVLFGIGFLFIAVFLLLLRNIKWLFNKSISGLSGLFNKRRVYV